MEHLEILGPVWVLDLPVLDRRRRNFNSTTVGAVRRRRPISTKDGYCPDFSRFRLGDVGVKALDVMAK